MKTIPDLTPVLNRRPAVTPFPQFLTPEQGVAK